MKHRNIHPFFIIGIVVLIAIYLFAVLPKSTNYQQVQNNQAEKIDSLEQVLSGLHEQRANRHIINLDTALADPIILKEYDEHHVKIVGVILDSTNIVYWIKTKD
jgi:hypothetical protein